MGDVEVHIAEQLLPTLRTEVAGAFEAIHSAASDLHRAGIITAASLREYDQLCVTPPPLSAVQIRALRRQLKVSQPVFAAFLNTTPSTVMQWESGKKRPGGMGLKLLHIAKARGLKGLAVGKSARSQWCAMLSASALTQ